MFVMNIIFFFLLSTLLITATFAENEKTEKKLASRIKNYGNTDYLFARPQYHGVQSEVNVVQHLAQGSGQVLGVGGVYPQRPIGLSGYQPVGLQPIQYPIYQNLGSGYPQAHGQEESAYGSGHSGHGSRPHNPNHSGSKEPGSGYSHKYGEEESGYGSDNSEHGTKPHKPSQSGSNESASGYPHEHGQEESGYGSGNSGYGGKPHKPESSEPKKPESEYPRPIQGGSSGHGRPKPDENGYGNNEQGINGHGSGNQGHGSYDGKKDNEDGERGEGYGSGSTGSNGYGGGGYSGNNYEAGGSYGNGDHGGGYVNNAQQQGQQGQGHWHFSETGGYPGGILPVPGLGGNFGFGGLPSPNYGPFHHKFAHIVQPPIKHFNQDVVAQTQHFGTGNYIQQSNQHIGEENSVLHGELYNGGYPEHNNEEEEEHEHGECEHEHSKPSTHKSTTIERTTPAPTTPKPTTPKPTTPKPTTPKPTTPKPTTPKPTTPKPTTPKPTTPKPTTPKPTTPKPTTPTTTPGPTTPKQTTPKPTTRKPTKRPHGHGNEGDDIYGQNFGTNGDWEWDQDGHVQGHGPESGSHGSAGDWGHAGQGYEKKQ